MKKLVIASLLVVAGASVGCSKNKNDGMAQVPPPPGPAPMEQASFEPVQVQTVEPAAAAPQPLVKPVVFEEPAPAPAVQTATHTIRKGDTLYSIARRHYGSGKQWRQILAANPGLDPQKLPVGKTIVLP